MEDEEWLLNLFDATNEIANSSFEVIDAVVTDEIIKSEIVLDVIVNAIVEPVIVKLDDSIAVLDSEFVTHRDEFDAIEDTNFNLESDIHAKLSDVLQTVQNTANEIVIKAEDKVKDSIVLIHTDTESTLEKTFNTLKDKFDALMNRAGQLEKDNNLLIDRLSDGVGFALPEDDEANKNNTNDQTNNLLKSIVEKISDIELPTVGEIASEGFNNFAARILPQFDFSAQGAIKEAIDPLIDMIEADETIPQALKDIFIGGSPTIALVAISAALFIPMAMIQNYITALMSPTVDLVSQSAMQRLKTTIIPADQFARLDNMGLLIGYSDQEEFKKSGVNDDRYNLIKELQLTRLSVGELSALRNRQEITENDYITALHNLGFRYEDIFLIDSLRFPIPPVQDIIRFAIRDVYNPEIMASSGQTLEIPPEYITDSAKGGLSTDWAEKYWAAHWSIPSVSNTFEMFQRGFITFEAMELQLKALDIAPLWRDELVKIAYHPITRVDIRRLYQDGIFGLDLPNEEDEFNTLVRESDPLATDTAINDMIKAYLDVGYNPEDAKRLTLFTARRYPQATTQVDKELTRSTVIRFYKEGLLTEEAALLRLLLLGYSETDANRFLAIEQLDALEKAHKLEIRIIEESIKRNSITLEQGLIEIDKLGVTPIERKLIESELKADLIPDARRLTKGELEALYSEKLIDINTLFMGLLDLGYSEENAILLMRLQAVELGAAMKKEIDILINLDN